MWKVTKKELIRYMKEHDIPMEFLNGEKIKILVIDDEKIVTRSIERIFHTDERFMLETANSGFSAGAKLEKFKPDIIILDIFLNDMDGREFFSHIRNHSELHDTKVIGISGRIDGEEIQSMINRGFTAFLKKPYKIDELKETINDVLK